MMRHITLTLFTLLVATTISQAQVLLNVRSEPPYLIELGQTYTLDLNEYFQVYNSPGPVATFTWQMPAQNGWADLMYATTGLFVPDYDPEKPTINMMTYEMNDGSTYTHLYDPLASGENFVWENHSIDFQLFADTAPVTVGNFIKYVNRDAYDGTIVHRSEKIDENGIGISIVQLGKYRLKDSESLAMYQIDKDSPITFEETVNNTQGTLAMARATALNSADSEFYINLDDNTDTLAKFYSVFGEVMNFETNMPILKQLSDVYVYNLAQEPYNIGTVFQTTPLYSPFVLKPENWLNVQDITVPEGSTDGISYGYEFGDLDGQEGTSDEEAANQAAFDFAINGNLLELSRNNSGVALLVVKGIYGTQERTFTIPITGYNPEALNAFPSAAIQTEGYLNSSWYGRMLAETFPEINHDNHGRQWVFYIEDPETFVYHYYIFDEQLRSWFYTRASLFPTIYVYSTGHWMKYVPTTGGSEDNPRWFYDFNTKQWVVYQ